MPRPLRCGLLDSIYHVTNRGVEKRPIFLTDRDRRVFLAYLRRDMRQAGASLLAYCLMTNHYHLLIYVDGVPLDVLMQRTMTRYAIYFNRVHQRVGHLFQGRYNAKLVRDYAYLINVVAYIHENPVEAGIVDHVSEWPWSSHREWMEMKGPLIDFHRFEEATGLSPAEMAALYRERIIHPDRSHDPASRSLQELINDAATAVGLPPSDLLGRKRSRTISRAKALLFEWTRQQGFSDVEVATALNCSQPAISQFRTRHQARV